MSNVKNRIAWNKGKKHTIETLLKISNSLKNSKKFQDAVRTPEYRDKHRILELNTKKFPNPKGEKSHSWKGGLSFINYNNEWTKELRISIRERDSYTCQICWIKQGDEAFNVHHIDYDKKNCNPKNLITLCRKCHMKTNFKREYWKEYFNNIKLN